MRLSPEYALLARAATGPERSSEREVGPERSSEREVGPERPSDCATPRGLRWPLALRLAERHRLLPLLDRHVRACSLDVPGFARSALAEATVATTARNLFLRAELHRLAETLAGHDIAVVLLKGAALIETVYLDVGLRPMLDLDLLVPASAARRAEAAIVAMGYRPNPMQTPEERERMRDEHHSGPALVRDDAMVAVDLHRHLSSRCPRLDIDDVWSSARRGAGEGSYLLPRPEDLLMHVALHFSSERARKSDGAFGQVADLAWLCATSDIDWDFLLGRARRWGAQSRLFLALWCATDLLGPIAPPAVLDDARPTTWSDGLARRTLRRNVLGTGPWVPPDYFTSHSGPVYSPRSRPLRRMFPSHDYLSRNFGSGDDATFGSNAEGYARLSLRRAARAWSKVARPWTVPADVKLGRWLESLDAGPPPEG